MKRIWVFILGVITGALIILIFGYLVTYNNPYGATFFSEPQESILEANKSLKVIQALEEGSAIATENKKYDLSDITVLLYNEEGNPYYDAQIIKIPSGKCARKIGIYKYKTNGGLDKTIPIVQIMNK